MMTHNNGQLVAQNGFVEQVVETDADACNLIGIGWSDAAPGGIYTIGTSGRIFHFVQNFMVWHNYMCTIRYQQIVGIDGMLLEISEFGEQILWIDGGSSTHNANAGRIEDTAGY
jgi:hypothetical protein